MAEAASKQILLVGPRVAHLAPFFEERGYRIDAHEMGTSGMQAIEERLLDLIVLELNLTDYSAADFLSLARGVQPDARFLLLDDPSRAGQIVKALQAGAMGYVSTPPDEKRLFEEVDRLLASPTRGGSKSEEVSRLEEDLEKARAETMQAEMQAQMLQQEIEALQAAAEEAKQAGPSEEELGELREKAGRVDQLEADAALSEDEKTELEEQIERLKKDLTHAQEAHAKSATELAAGEDLKSRLSDFEQRVKDRDARIESLEEELSAQKEARASEEEAKDAARREADEAEERARSLAQELEALRTESGETSASAEKARQEADEARRKAEQAEKAAEERARQAEARSKEEIAAADERARKAEERADAEAERVREELQGEIQKAHNMRDAMEEKYLERELDMDGLQAEIADLKEQLEAEKSRHAEAEAAWKKEKLRFVEEREAAGADEAYRKMEAMLEELTRLRQLKLAYEERYGSLEGHAAAGKK